MKKVLGFFIILLMVIILTGCIDVDSSSSGLKPSTSMKAQPKYTAGDIVGQEPGDDTGSLILSYSTDSDIYTTQQVYFEPYYKKGQWVYYDWRPQTYRREFEESYDPYYLLHIDPGSIEKYDFSKPL